MSWSRFFCLRSLRVAVFAVVAVVVELWKSGCRCCCRRRDVPGEEKKGGHHNEGDLCRAMEGITGVKAGHVNSCRQSQTLAHIHTLYLSLTHTHIQHWRNEANSGFSSFSFHHFSLFEIFFFSLSLSFSLLV